MEDETANSDAVEIARYNAIAESAKAIGKAIEEQGYDPYSIMAYNMKQCLKMLENQESADE